MSWHARILFRAVCRCACRCACYDLCSLSHVHMHPCTHAYHALTRVLGPCAVACADAFARTYVLALHMPAACADARARAYVLARMQHIRAAMYFRNTCEHAPWCGVPAPWCWRLGAEKDHIAWPTFTWGPSVSRRSSIVCREGWSQGWRGICCSLGERVAFGHGDLWYTCRFSRSRPSGFCVAH